MLHGLVSFGLLPFSNKILGNSSLSNSHVGGGWGTVVIGGGGSDNENFGLLSISVWCLFVSGGEKYF